MTSPHVPDSAFPQWAFSDRRAVSDPFEPLDEAEAARAGRLKRREDAQDFLHARWLARSLAAQTLPGAGEVRLESFDDARPQITGWPEAAISWSRSGPLGVAAIQASGLIGIDIERKAARQTGPMLDMVAQPQEAECVLSAGAETERLERFYRLWTAKEAVLKARGKGLRGGAKKVEIPEDFISGERDAATLVETFGVFRLVRLDVGTEACCSLVFSVRTGI